MQLAEVKKCSFAPDFMQQTIDSMTQPAQEQSTMYQDFTARRPMEVETYLGAPCQLAKEAGIAVPRIETMYTILRHINVTNKDRPVLLTNGSSEGTTPVPQPAKIAMNPPRPINGHPMNGMNGGPGHPMAMRPGPNGRPMGPPPVRRGPPPVNGYRGPPGNYQRGPNQLSHKQSFGEDNTLDEFQHIVLYDEIPDGDVVAAYGDPANGNAVALRERELMLREKEIRLREQEMAMRARGGGAPRRPSHNKHQAFIDDDDDDDDYFDPMDGRNHNVPAIDPDNFDMMSVTSRRTKRAPSQSQLRRGMFEGQNPGMRPGSYNRSHGGRHRTSAQLMSDMPILGANIMDNPMMGFASNRYGNVDRKEMADESRANSLTASRLQEMGGPGGPYPPPSRRTSRSPGNPLSPMGPGPAGPMGRPHGRPSPPNDPYMQGRPNGRPSPPGGMQAPVPRYPPGQANMMHQHAVEQVGVSKPFPPKPTKSLTGSASASAGSGDSGSANTESDPSAHSSTSSFVPGRTMMGVH